MRLKYIYLIVDGKKKVMKLNMSFYGQKEGVRLWNILPFKKFWEVALKEMQSSPGIFLGEDSMSAGCADDSIVLAKSDRIVDSIEQKLRNMFTIKHLGKGKQFTGVEFAWNENGAIAIKQTGKV